jgi:ribosome recycling factor
LHRHASRLTTASTSHPQPRTTFSQRTPHRLFTTSPALQKKGAKAARDEAKTTSSSSKNDPSSSSTEDPNDFTALEAEITASITRLKDDLSKLRAGGRFNPELLENLRVQPDKNNAQKVRLSDVAQVVPKGRTVQILVGEKEHVKPITSAIQASTLSLTPQPDPTGANPLLLVVNIPPPTADSRKAAVAEAAKAGEKAGMVIKDARAKQQKKLRAMQLGKTARPDELKKAGTAMEKVVEKGGSEVKKVVDAAKKVLESG